MCSLCESVGRGVHFNPYASLGKQVHTLMFPSFALGACRTAEAWGSCFAARHIHLLQNIKYGVMSTSALLHDLWTWDDFFMAGRLHKPVLHFVRDHLVDRAVRANLDSALAAALLCLPANFTCQVCCTTLPSPCRKAPLQNVRIRPTCPI